MRVKTLVIVVVVLAALSVVAWWTGRPPAAAAPDPRVGKVLVDPPSLVDQAAKLRLSDGGKTVTLTRQSDGSWKDASYYDLPVDFSKLSSFVSDLTSAKIERLVTTSPETLDRLEFKDSKIELLGAGNRVIWSVELGKNADMGGRFVRFDSEPRAYLASLNAWLDSDAKNWADATLTNLKSDDIAKVEIGFEAAAAAPKNNAVLDKLDQLKKYGAAEVHETVTVSRAKKDDPWVADKPRPGQRISADKVSSVLGSLTSLRFTDTSSLDDPQAIAARAHSRRFRLTTFDGKTYTILLGRKPEEKKLKPAPPVKKEAAKAPPTSGQPNAAKTAAGGKGSPSHPEKPPEPEYETIPAGPVFVWVTSSDRHAPVNALMRKRAFQVDEYTYTSLPQKSDELFEAAPAAPKPPPKK